MKISVAIFIILIIGSNADLLSGILSPVKNLLVSEAKKLYMKLGEKIKTIAGDALKKLKDKQENVQSIFKEFLENAKGVSKDVLVEAIDFIKPYNVLAIGNITLQCFNNEIPEINASINTVVDKVNATMNNFSSAVEACGDDDCVNQLVMLRLTIFMLKKF